MTKKVLVPLANGFEEIEAVTIIDVLRRAGVEVVVAGVGEEIITGAHGLKIGTDGLVDYLSGEQFDMIALPGGMPGAKNLAESEVLGDMLRRQRTAGGMIAAICAAPAVVLGTLGLLGEEKVTCYPAFRGNLPDENQTYEPVHADGTIITGEGPAAALEFSLELVRHLVGKKKADSLASAMLA